MFRQNLQKSMRFKTDSLSLFFGFMQKIDIMLQTKRDIRSIIENYQIIT